MKSTLLDHSKYYRLPWSYSDNAISWLEPTEKCNLTCKGCYRNTAEGKHKSLDEIRQDLEIFKKYRKSDCISIAGGDPLVHPEIMEIVSMIREMDWKPIINTNGLALTEVRLRELKDAGAFGFTFHIDTSQSRPGIDAKSEVELNDERLKYAQMLAEVGGLSCSFNSTVTEKTLPEVPELMRWAQKHADLVHTMVFILYRSPALTGNFNFLAHGENIEFGTTYKETGWAGRDILHTPDVVEKIREADPLYEPCAYLNGTAKPDSLKWLLANRIVFNGKTTGYVSPKFMEMVQILNHIFTGKYLSYVTPGTARRGKFTTFLGGLADHTMRKLFFRILGMSLANPLNFFRRAHNQAIMIIQPVNIVPDGRIDMCDSCPDITVYQGKLVWSCRLEEMKEFGTFVTAVPKGTREHAV
jgi:hypothetical protein